MNNERATLSEKPIIGERAILSEKPRSDERAILNEKPRSNKRAIDKEKPNMYERANIPEETKERKRKEGNMKERISIPIPTLVDATLAIEKLRVASEVRQSHLARQGKSDTETNELHRRLVDLENYVDDRMAALLKAHPAYPWFSRVKGIGGENIGKVIGLIDIEKADTISSLWKFAGFAPVDGKAEKRQKGVKLHYNSQLRSMCWRLANSLLRTRGKFYEYYLKEKDKYQQRFQNEGRHIVPATQLPKKDGRKYEPDNMITEGHVHNMALRKMIKLFLALLWLTWREAEGLPTGNPYPVEYLGHEHLITPEEMCDR